MSGKAGVSFSLLALVTLKTFLTVILASLMKDQSKLTMVSGCCLRRLLAKASQPKQMLP